MCEPNLKYYSPNPEDLTFLTKTERIFYIVIYSALLVISLSANICAIKTVINRNSRFLQKASLVSLAASDLLMTFAYVTNNMETFSHEMINWTLGHLMCSLIPMMQIAGLIANLLTIVVISLDRYKNVVKALTQRWNPSPLECILGFCMIWVFSMGVSYPMFTMYEVKVLRVHPSIHSPKFKTYDFCVTNGKENLFVYYICIVVFVLFTMLALFLELNFNVAKLIWKHRKPLVSSELEKSEISTISQETSCARTNTSSTAGNKTTYQKITCKNNRNVKRKIRTFKVIVLCMTVFTICRLPFWIFNIAKLAVGTMNEPCYWLVMYAFNILALLNCVLDPFIYVFLNQTLKFLSKIWKGLLKFAKMCCLIEEFDSFKREYPFLEPDYCEKRKERAKKELISYRIP